MQGNRVLGDPFYRCRLSSADYACPPDGHPRSLAVRENRLLSVLDSWLVDLFDPEHLEEVADRTVLLSRSIAP